MPRVWPRQRHMRTLPMTVAAVHVTAGANAPISFRVTEALDKPTPAP